MTRIFWPLASPLWRLRPRPPLRALADMAVAGVPSRARRAASAAARRRQQRGRAPVSARCSAPNASRHACSAPNASQPRMQRRSRQRGRTPVTAHGACRTPGAAIRASSPEPRRARSGPVKSDRAGAAQPAGPGAARRADAAAGRPQCPGPGAHGRPPQVQANRMNQRQQVQANRAIAVQKPRVTAAPAMVSAGARRVSPARIARLRALLPSRGWPRFGPIASLRRRARLPCAARWQCSGLTRGGRWLRCRLR